MLLLAIKMSAIFAFKRDLLLHESILLAPSKLYFSLKSFAAKMLLFCVIKFLICQFDDSRIACRYVDRGFLPSLVVFGLMDFLVIPRLHRRIRDR